MGVLIDLYIQTELIRGDMARADQSGMPTLPTLTEMSRPLDEDLWFLEVHGNYEV